MNLGKPIQKQESPSVWLQEAYRPRCSQFSGGTSVLPGVYPLSYPPPHPRHKRMASWVHPPAGGQKKSENIKYKLSSCSRRGR